MSDERQVTLFDSGDGLRPWQGSTTPARAARDEALDRVDAHADPEWKDRALDAVRLIATQNTEFIADELWKHVERPHEPRASGPIMLRARREGWISPTERFRQSPSRTSHANPVRVWRSLIYRGGA